MAHALNNDMHDPRGQGQKLGATVDSATIMFILLLVAGGFVLDMGRRCWRDNEWKRRRRNEARSH